MIMNIHHQRQLKQFDRSDNNLLTQAQTFLDSKHWIKKIPEAASLVVLESKVYGEEDKRILYSDAMNE